MVPELADEPGFVHGFSTLAVGSVGLKHAPDPGPILGARKAFLHALDLDGVEPTTIGSVHGAEVARVDEPGGAVDDVDALLTDRSGVALFATYADCYPIVLWDPEKRVAGLVHAGWRGTQAGVSAAAARFMRDEYGCRHVRAGIGPGSAAAATRSAARWRRSSTRASSARAPAAGGCSTWRQPTLPSWRTQA